MHHGSRNRRDVFAQATGARIALACILAILPCSAYGEDAAPPPAWPEFRGPFGNGVAVPQEGGPPLTWSETENVVWKVPIPHRGWSTPVVMDGQIWLTTATIEGHEMFVICLDAETGREIHHKKLFHVDEPEPLGNNINSYASPSPVITPGRVFVHFGSYGTACLDTATGEVLWQRRDLPCRHFRGPGSSPILFENYLILTFDGADVQYLAALDANTGETIWKTHRSTNWPDLDEHGRPKRDGDFRKAFTTPVLAMSEGVPLVISPGSFSGFAYHARTGQEVWHTRNASYSPAVRPVYADGVVYMTAGRGPSEMWAVRVNGQGDVTDSHTLWKVSGRIVPEEPSPILVDGLLYLVSNQGVVTCLEADTGKEVWSERIGGNYMGSPVYADGRIYVASVQGRTTVLQAGRTFNVLAVNTLDTGALASPVVVGNTLFLRTRTHLYRLEAPRP